MATSKSICLVFLLICSSVYVCLSQSNNLPCVQRLLPCHDYLKSSTMPPPSCCIPMRQIVGNDVDCLCKVFNDPAILKGLNITQQDGLNLSQRCGATANTALCQKVAPTPGATPGSNSTVSSPPPSHRHSGASHVITQVGRVMSLAAIFSSLIVSVF